MSTAQRVAGVAGTFSYTLNVVPFGIPQLTIYSDVGRTVVALASAPTVATGNPSVFTASYPSTLAAGTYYLSFSTVITNAQPPLVDADDTLVLATVIGTVNPVLITLAEAKLHLNIGTGDTGHDTEIQSFIDAATPVVEHVCGPIVGSAYAESYDGGLAYISLRHNPVQVVTSVIEYRGTAAYVLAASTVPGTGGAYQYSVELDTGRVIRRSSGVETPFPIGRGSVVIAYTAGRATVPPNITLAAKELVRHWYQQTQQGGRPTFAASGAIEDITPAVLQGFAVPNRVRELLMPHKRAPSVA